MPEDISITNNKEGVGSGSGRGSIETEIAELSQKISEKRKLLETEVGVIEEREVVRQALAEKITPSITSSTTTTTSSQTTTPAIGTHTKTTPSYLDTLDEESVAEVQRLVGIVFDKGFDEAIKEAGKNEPFIIDAFHDALVDRLYDELKSRGIVK